MNIMHLADGRDPWLMPPLRANGHRSPAPAHERTCGPLATSNEQANLTAFYFDNPNFRAREGDRVPYKDTTVVVAARVNFANDFSRRFVGRDSPQVAARQLQGCPNLIQKRDASQVEVDHCGGVSLWRVESGGRMGMVLGEDATEVAPPATNCTHQCQAQNRVRGRSVVLGFPFPVPATSRLAPRFPPEPSVP